MTSGFHIVVCAGPVPDPLQTLEPVMGPAGPALKNEAMLPAVLDPWAAHALYEAAHLADAHPGSKVWLVSLGPKPRLQQLMMTVAQKVPFELVALDGPSGAFTDPVDVGGTLAAAIASIPGLERSRLLLFGGCASASRDAGVTLSVVAERLELGDFFLGVDAVKVEQSGTLRVLERIEGGRYQVSECSGPPAAMAWATGTLPEPPNNPQVGMLNMRGILPALQKAASVTVGTGGTVFTAAEKPSITRQTRVVKDRPPEEIARELAAWIREG